MISMKLKIVILFFAISALASCRQGSDALFQSDGGASSAFGAAAPIVDAAAVLTVSATNETSLNYSETDEFDRALYATMKGQTPTITVDFEGFLITKTQLQAGGSLTVQTPRIQRWIWKVRDSGGLSIACQEPPNRSILAMVAMLGIKIVADVIKNYITYNPAEKYNVRSFFDAHTNTLIRVEFIRRDLTTDLRCDTPLPGT
jgi:hypothetical protein